MVTSTNRPPAGEGSPQGEPEAAGEAPLERLRVLVVEDNVVNRQILQLVLRKKFGIASVAVEDGESAVEAAAAEPFDVVLMDLQMPGIDGVEATRRIRERSGEGPPVILALSASTVDADRDRCLAAGMDGFLTKPVVPADLRGELERCALRMTGRA
ncbi:MAG: two-component system, sensor histidine kinase [Actinomycetota bacterium]|nr:two-component system, sensor histidine kinase [Actinomycetota bacterium]